MNKYRLITVTVCLLILPAFLLFNFFIGNRNLAKEAFNADAATKEEITDELVYRVDSSGNKELAGYEHLKSFEVPEKFQKYIP